MVQYRGWLYLLVAILPWAAIFVIFQLTLGATG